MILAFFRKSLMLQWVLELWTVGWLMKLLHNAWGPAHFVLQKIPLLRMQNYVAYAWYKSHSPQYSIYLTWIHDSSYPPFSSLVRLILSTRMCLEKSTAPTNFTMNASNSGSSTRTFVHSAGKSQSNSQIKHEGFPSWRRSWIFHLSSFSSPFN